MTNPYEPPQQPATDVPLDGRFVKGKFKGGFWNVTAIGILGGLLVAFGMAGADTLPMLRILPIPLPFLVTAVAWIGAFVALMFLLRGVHLEPSTKILAPMLLAIPAYILYVPVCTFSAMFTSTFMGSDGYGPTIPGMTLASVVCFVGILLLFAAGVRSRFKGRPEINPSGDASSDNTTFFTPTDELKHE